MTSDAAMYAPVTMIAAPGVDGQEPLENRSAQAAIARMLNGAPGTPACPPARAPPGWLGPGGFWAMQGAGEVRQLLQGSWCCLSSPGWLAPPQRARPVTGTAALCAAAVLLKSRPLHWRACLCLRWGPPMGLVTCVHEHARRRGLVRTAPLHCTAPAGSSPFIETPLVGGADAMTAAATAAQEVLRMMADVQWPLQQTPSPDSRFAMLNEMTAGEGGRGGAPGGRDPGGGGGCTS